MSKIIPLLLVSIGLALTLGASVGTYFESRAYTKFIFMPDEGIRAKLASNAGVKMNGSNLLLLYESHSPQGGQRIDIAKKESGWLSFSSKEETMRPDNFRAHRLPDGTWRAYKFDTTTGTKESCLTSQSSINGITFTPDEGCRYKLQKNDGDTMGVYDFFNTSKGDVVLLYIGDLMGKNNIRKAISQDNGKTFTFKEANVLRDDDAGGGGQSYVDEKSIALDKKTFYLVTMKSGIIYGFLSTDDGETFKPQGEILRATDFTIANGSLHDPQIIKLPNGHYRIFVTLINQTTGETDIVSATTQK